MKRIFIMLFICILFVGCTKDWGRPTTRDYPIDGIYNGLDVSDAFQVTMSDQVNNVVVTVNERAHERVLVEVKNGKLHIGFKPNTRYDDPATAVIPANTILELNLSGASSFTGNLEVDQLDINLSGASIYSGNISAEKVHLNLSGASTYTGSMDAYKIFTNLSGASTITTNGIGHTFMEIDLSGASHLNAVGLNAPTIFGGMSGGSFADVTCCSSLEVELSGGSTLTYGTVSDDCHPVINCPCTGGSTVGPRP